ncbi:hypothetical protein MCOR27_003484 [Pyricularia oryzae]|nr:hypothetical protein MCOR01_005359 [Pyricularia oryzae]KAI6282975.1 hypothetical protein MCOR27_003484 [Pyricularia oryzae]KAI6410325.1 hypothetical protein MCOR23_000490 [Pyricularia oryzae]KAI6570271.1 hypothetical protein MCOR09_004855 [Pyricularia oryzae]
MDAIAAMPQPAGFDSQGLSARAGGLASRRGGQGVKPLTFDQNLSPGAIEPAAPTPRTTARSHLLAGLRTAPKSATAATFAQSGTINAGTTGQNRNSLLGHESLYNGPKTSLPRFAQQQGQNTTLDFAELQQQRLQEQQQQQQQQRLQEQQQQQQLYLQRQQEEQLLQQQQQQQQQQRAAEQRRLQQQQQLYTADQILAPPEIRIEEQSPEHMDPAVYANLVSTNLYLAQQQQRLQQQLMTLQAAQQQFQTMNINGVQNYHTAYQQQQLQQQQAALMQQQAMINGIQTAQGTIYAMYDPVTGQPSYYLNQSPQVQNQYGEQYGYQATPRVQVSPPPAESHMNGFRNSSPPRRFQSPGGEDHTPLPPPSANAFRRGHKKSTSISNGQGGLSVAVNDSSPKSAGPKTANFPLTPGGYGPGQARAGEHPIRQPNGPPSFDELRSKPTSKHEGSKNFAGRARRSALSNLVRAGITRSQVRSPGSSGSISPISESAEEMPTPLTEDDDSVSGSGSLNGDDDVDCHPPSSRTSTGSWGAIGSNRPASKAADTVSIASDSDSVSGGGSFASMFKVAGKQGGLDGSAPRKTPMLVLNRAGAVAR